MIKNGRLLYHLTALENLASILQHGLKPRCDLNNDEFNDVADGEILDSRANHSLDNFVPFHFFAKNPFDYSVQRTYSEKDFVLISVQRTVARANGWKIVPTHPLAKAGYQILDYDAGFIEIDWELMEERDYDDKACKVVCMAECLSPTTVSSDLIFCIYIKYTRVKAVVDKLVNLHNVCCHVDINPAMFVGE